MYIVNLPSALAEIRMENHIDPNVSQNKLYIVNCCCIMLGTSFTWQFDKASAVLFNLLPV